jgi:hypothetical protein
MTGRDRAAHEPVGLRVGAVAVLVQSVGAEERPEAGLVVE